jgi:hypothetical protein
MSKMLVTILFCGLCAYFALFAVKKRAFGVDSFFNQNIFGIQIICLICSSYPFRKMTSER